MNIRFVEHFKELIKEKEEEGGKVFVANSIPYFIKENGFCFCCGETDRACLDFHHVDSSTKRCSVTNKGLGKKSVWEEIEKCELVCSNCHRRIHHYGISVYDLANLFESQRDNRLELGAYEDRPEGPHLTVE